MNHPISKILQIQGLTYQKIRLIFIERSSIPPLLMDHMLMYNKQIMAQRFIQEDKFKNITLKLDQAPMHASNIVRATNGENKEVYRPSTPINSSKYVLHQGKNINIEIRTSNISHHDRISPNTSSPKAKSQIRQKQQFQHEDQQQYENNNECNYELKRQLEEKEEIISELKNIIKLSNENNSRIRPKSIYQSQKSPDRERTYEQEQRELKELRHNVKVLTIENNALSGYIDKLKDQLAEKNSVKMLENSLHQRKAGNFQRQHKDLAIIEQLRQENQRLHELVREKENISDRKIDEYVATYKSLANECKRLENCNEQLQAENERLNSMLRDLQETQRRVTNRDQEKLGKTMTTEKLSIVKIKEQYAESIKQISNTVHLEYENLFDNFRLAMSDMDKKISFLQKRVKKIEEELRVKSYDLLRLSREATKKSEIYIQQGSQSFSQSSRRINNGLKSVVISRLFQDSHGKNTNNDQNVILPLQQEIGRLKDIISDLQNQMSERSDYYTFRERYQSSQAQISSYRAKVNQKEEELKAKERETIYEINRLKDQIDRLEEAYRNQKYQMQQKQHNEIEQREEEISKIRNQYDDLRSKYLQVLDDLKRLEQTKGNNEELYEQILFLKEDNLQFAKKIDQYKKLCNLLQEQSQQNTFNYQLFDEMKKQLVEIKERYHLDLHKFNATQRQNREILIANQELKHKLEHSLALYHKVQAEFQLIKGQHNRCEVQKEELVQRTRYNEKVIAILQNQIKAKKDIEVSLIEEKNSLEKQLINYLSIFNKLNFDDSKSNRKEKLPQQLGIQDLLSKLSRIQASFNDMHSSKSQKQQIISKLMCESFDQLSSIKRKDQVQ